MNKKVGRYIRKKFHKKRWRQFAFMMACIVVFCTTYALLLPAVTLEKTAECGLEEHQHEESCYENQLVCGNKESDGHRHTDSCYRKVLVCGKEVHVHSENCFHGRTRKGTLAKDKRINASAKDSAKEIGEFLSEEAEDSEETAVDELAANSALDTQAEEDSLHVNPAEAGEAETVWEETADGEAEITEEQSSDADAVIEADTASDQAADVEADTASEEFADEAADTESEKFADEAVVEADIVSEEVTGEGTAGETDTASEEAPGVEYVGEADTASEVTPDEETGADEEAFSGETEMTEDQPAEEETTEEAETLQEETAAGEAAEETETLQEGTSNEETEAFEENSEWEAETVEEQSANAEAAEEAENLTEETANDKTGQVEENPGWEAGTAEEQSSIEEIAPGTETASEESAGEEAAATTEQATSDIVTEDGAAPAQEASPQLACQGPDYEVIVTSDVEEGIPKDASLSVSEIMPETTVDNADTDDNTDTDNNTYTELTYEEYISRTEETLGLEEDSDFYIRLFDIKIVDEYGKKIKLQTPVNVKIRLTDLEGSDFSNAQIVHFADETNEAEIAEETNGKEKTDSEALSESETKSATTPSRNTEATGKAKKIRKVAKAEKEKKSDVIQDVTVEAGVLPEDGTTLSFVTEGFSVFALVGTTIEKTVLASDGHNYRITATYGAETGIPEDADLAVEEILPTEQDDSGVLSVFDEYVSRTENALGWEAGSASYARVFDIKIVDKDDPEVKYQPKDGSKVDVRIELADKDSSEQAAASTQVVHFADGVENGDIIENSTTGQLVSFNALSFSIYAIVDSSKRLQYNFYDGTSLLASEYIKKQDNILQELYDPGVEPEYGQTLVGWAYSPGETNPANIYTIKQLNQQAADKYNSATEELTEINVYAIYDEAWYLRYMDQDVDGNATVLKVVRVRKEAADKNVKIDYSFTPEEGIVFEGWTDVATGQTYQQGETITLDHHVDLYVKLQGRNWLVFDSNAGGPGSGATYTPPQLLIGNEATTQKPDDPTRRGYTFTGWNTKADGTGTWWYRAGGSEDLFGDTLSDDTTLYAQWEAAPQNYYVVFWRQKSSDEAGLSDSEKTYEYIGTETRNSTTGSVVSLESNDKNRNTGVFENCSFNSALSDDESVIVNADGTTTLNVYYDLNAYVLTFEVTGGSGTRYRYDLVGNDDGSSTVYGYINGEWKQLTRSGLQNTVWYFRYVYTANNGGGYRIYDDTKTYTGWRNVSSGQRYRRTGYSSATNDNTYNGTRYTRSGSDYYNYSYSETTATEGNQFGVDTNGAFVELGKETETTYSYTYDDNGIAKAYSGPIYIRTNVNNSTSRWTYKTISALYGHSIADQFPITYNGSSRWFDSSSTYYSSDYVLVSIDKMPPANIVFRWSSADGKKTRIMNYYVEGLEGNEDGYSYNGYTSDTLYPGTEKEKRYKNYDTVLYNQIVAQYNFVTRDEDYIDIKGFTKWETDPAFNSNGIALNNNKNVDTINMYYKRNKYTINYISKGSHVTEQSIKNDDKVYFEASLADYGKKPDGTWYYEPTNGNEGYFFEGWYLDEECTQPFDFANEEMPSNHITVYAKWDTYRVRVVLVPTVNNAHNDEVELANNQSLSFRMDYNEEISDANINSSVAKRAGYKLIGWYYSPDFDPNTEIHFPLTVNKDTPGVDMNYQSGDDWDKYGDNDGSHDNVRGIMKLYAKWELDVDENSVYVEYDVDDVYRTYDTAGMLQTTIPVDNDKYALTDDNVTFQVAEAPTKYTSGFEFYKWVLLNPDGSESNMEFNRAEMASEIPSSFIYEETITDDLGHTATIKKIRLKAKFNIETEKVTTVTFDGNGGVTNDSAQQESVTESYPINKDFFMKDEDSFVREGYTLLGWAFERDNGSKITPEAYKQAIAEMTADQLIQAGIYQLGQKVAADNLKVSDENNWNPLENTVYAVWEINTYTVTVKKVVDGETETNKEFIFAASANGDYTIPTGDSPFTLVNGGEKTFTEVPYGTLLTFSETPASGYSIKDVDAKQITNPDKTLLQETDYINLEGEDNKPYTIKGDVIITYTNEKAKEQKLRIHKIGNDATSGLAGAKFDLTSNDAEGFINKKGIVSMGGTAPESLGYLPSGDASDGSLFTLPNGTYTLTETKAPQHYDGIAGTVTLNVTGDGISITKVGTDVEAPFEGVAISEKDLNGIYTLTITNTRKLATVTIIKNVIGTNADKDAEYSFKATGLTATQDTFKLHGRQIPDTVEEGTTPTQENTKVYTNIPYGTVFSVTEDSTYTDFDTTIAISNEETPVTAPRLTTGNVTVDGDVTITYTNTRNKQPVKVFKYETGTSPEKPLSDAVFSLTGPEGSDVSYTGLTTNSDGYLVYEENIVLELPVNTGTYTLTETQAPDGYQIIGDGNTTFTVSPGLVTGAVAETELIEGEEIPSVVFIIKIQNSAGVELPSTGGPGTSLIHLLGIMLTGLAGTRLVMRKRRKAA